MEIACRSAMRGSLASQGSMMISEKGIEGITPDNDFINKLLVSR